MSSHTPGRRSGFTLVELLVVIAIIGVLVTLVTVAGWRAIITVREWTIMTDVNQLEGGITAYKGDRGDYPPDTISLDSSTPAAVLKQNVVLAHLKKLFPRHREGNPFLANRGDGQPGAFYAALNATGAELDPSETYVYFLTRLYDNPEYPLSGPGNFKVLHDFDSKRLVDLDGDGFPSFVPAYGSTQAPYCYFDSRTYGVSLVDRSAANQGVARPYCTTNGPPVVFESPTTFQIISAGLDAHFGNLPTGGPPPPFKQYPQGVFYQPEDRDNVTSFSETSLDSKLP